MQDLVAGQIDIVVSDPTTRNAADRSDNPQGLRGQRRTTRLPALPGVPTAAEASLPGFQVSTWNALFAPRARRRPFIAKLNAAAVVALADPAVRARLEAGRPGDSAARKRQTPEALGALLKADIEKWWPIIRAANIRAEWASSPRTVRLV